MSGNPAPPPTSPDPRTPPTPPTNWAGNITFHAARVHRPSSVAEVQTVVARESRVRALGTAHSFNDIADAPGMLVSLDAVPFRADIDSARRTVRIGPGVRYAELGAYLHGHGFALRNLGSLPHISVAGSCATATHGSGVTNGGLATAVTEIEMVTATGDVVRLRRGADPHFDGAVVALGVLGVVVGLTLDLVPAFAVRQYVYEGMALDALGDHFAEIVGAAYSVSLFTGWRGSRIDQVWVKHRVDAAARDAARPDATRPDTPVRDDAAVRDDTAGPARPSWFGAVLADGPRHPVAGMSADACTGQRGVPGPWHERLPHFRPDHTPSVGAELQSEYLLPREHAMAAVRALDRVGADIAPALMVSEIRTVAADELWLSPCYRRDAVAIHFTWIRDERAVLPAIRLVEERLAPFSPRPHWGKIFTLAPADLRARYERLPDFVELARHYDPAGKFANAYVDRYLRLPGSGD